MTRRLRDVSAAHPEPRSPGLTEVVTDLSRQNSVYRRTIEVCDALAGAALQGVDPAELTGVFAAVTGKRVVLLDAHFALRAQAGHQGRRTALRWRRSDPSVDRLLSALAGQRRPLRVPAIPGSLLEHGCLITPVVVGADTLGFLVVLDDVGEPDGASDPDDVDLLTATYAATLFALTMAHERTSTELGLRYQRSVVDALVSGHFLDDDDARRKARSLGLGEATPYRVAVLRIGPPVDESEPTEHSDLVERLAAIAPQIIAAGRQSGVVMIIPETEPDAATPPFEELWRSVAPGNGVTCGISELLDRPEQTPRGFAQAEQAIDLGLRLGRAGQLIDYVGLGVYRLLLRTGDMAELWGWADEVLGPLLDYDVAHTVDLVHTLSVYLSCHGSLKQAARELRVHANTIAYRTQRIESLTGLDLADPDDRLVAHVAIKIIESRRAPEAGT